MLELLVTQHGEIISRDDFIETVWDGRHVSNHTIDNRMKSVRAAIGDDGRSQRRIKTYPNRGYRFIDDVRVLKKSQSHPFNHNTPETAAMLNRNVGDNSSILNPFSMLSYKSILASILVLGMIFITAGILIERNTSNTQDLPPLTAATPTPRPHNANHLPQPNGTSKIAVMPIEVIGEDPERPFLSRVIESELRQAITAIQGVAVVSITSTDSNIEDAIELLELDYIVRAEKIYLGTEIQVSIQLVCIADNAVLLSRKYTLDDSTNQALSEWPAASAINATIEIANALEVSINQQANYLVPYAFQEKLVRAKSLVKSNRLDAINEAIIILGEVIKEEEKMSG